MDLYIHGGYSLTVNTGTIVFTAAKTYTVSFNANGGKRFDYRMLRCTGKNSCSFRTRVFLPKRNQTKRNCGKSKQKYTTIIYIVPANAVTTSQDELPSLFDQLFR